MTKNERDIPPILNRKLLIVLTIEERNGFGFRMLSEYDLVHILSDRPFRIFFARGTEVNNYD